MFDNNFGNLDQFSKFFQEVICRKTVYVHTQGVPSHLQYFAALPCEILKSKKVTELSR